MKRNTIVAAAAVTSAALALAGCAQGTPTDAGTSGSAASDFTIVASTTQVADFTRNIVGDEGNVVQIVQPNQSAHDIELTAADKVQLQDASAVVVNGLGLDHVVSDAADASKVIDASTGITPIPAAEEGHEEESSEDAHEELENDPHIWTDPENAISMVNTITDGLAKAEPDHADDFKANAKTYTDKLRKLDDWIEESFAPVDPADRTFVSTHDAFGYFVAAFDITQDASVLGSLDDNAEPSEQQLNDLIAQIQQTGVKAIFSEASIDPKLADSIASKAGVKLYSGDDALYGDSLGEEGSDGATYIDATVHNVRLIAESWGQQAQDPEGLD